VHVHIHAARGAFIVLHVTYGDLTYDQKTPDSNCADTPPDQPQAAAPFEYDTTLTHLYATPGRYHLEATTTVASQCPAPPGEVDHWAHTTADVDLASGYGANGPLLPQLQPNFSTDFGGTTMNVPAWDDDGWIQSVTIDWGDGTPPVTASNDGACTMYAGYARGIEFLPPTQRHSYETHGAHVATITGTSTDCNGQSPQTERQTVTIKT